MGFHEDGVYAGCYCGFCEDGGEGSIASGGSAEAAGALDGVGGIEADAGAEVAHPGERAHVGDEVVVAEGGAALGEEDVFAAEVCHFFEHWLHIPGGEKLAFFHVHGATGFCGSFEEISLAAEEGGNLEQIDVLAGDGCVLGEVDIGGDGDAEVLADFAEELAAVFNAHAAIGAYGGAIGFVVGGFEDEGDAYLFCDGFDFACHFPGEIWGFDGAWAEDEEWERGGFVFGERVFTEGEGGEGGRHGVEVFSGSRAALAGRASFSFTANRLEVFGKFRSRRSWRSW